MIVKINVNDGWVFLDDVYHVEVRKYCREVVGEDGRPYFTTQSKSKFDADFIVRNIYLPETDERAKEFNMVSCFRNNNHPICYAFNTNGYLMDDKGHTIESI